MQNNTKTFIEDLLSKLGISDAVVEVDDTLGQTIYKIKTEQSSALIGAHGDVLRAFNYIVKQMISHADGDTHFMVDINDYRSKKIEEVQKTAKLLAERAQSLKYNVEMQPMSSYERMLAHSVIDGMEGVTTESIGSGRERRVVIKFVG